MVNRPPDVVCLKSRVAERFLKSEMDTESKVHAAVHWAFPNKIEHDLEVL